MTVPRAFATVQAAGNKAISPNPGFGRQLLDYYYTVLHPELSKPIDGVFCKMCKYELMKVKTSNEENVQQEDIVHGMATKKQEEATLANEEEDNDEKQQVVDEQAQQQQQQHSKTKKVTKKQKRRQANNNASKGSNTECEMLFMNSNNVKWLHEQDNVKQGLVTGTIRCPNCDRKLGSFHSESMKCSTCFEPVTPGYQVFRYRISFWQ